MPPPTSPEDFYSILGVAADANDEEIKAAYRRQSRLWHPDVNSAPEAVERFKLINQARDTLLDPNRRAAYDEARPPRLRLGSHLIDFGAVRAGHATPRHVIHLYNDGGDGEIECSPASGSFWQLIGRVSFNPDALADIVFEFIADPNLVSGTYEQEVIVSLIGSGGVSSQAVTIKATYVAAPVSASSTGTRVAPAPPRTIVANPHLASPRKSSWDIDPIRALIPLGLIMMIVPYIIMGKAGLINGNIDASGGTAITAALCGISVISGIFVFFKGLLG